jgi:hypothetical protein
MAIQNLAGITAALCVFACVDSGHANLQPDISQLTGLDVPEGLKQFIGSMVSGLQADKEALQAMQAQIDELQKDRDALQKVQNKTQVVEAELRQQNAALSVEVVEVRGALHQLSNKTSTDVMQITSRLDKCDAHFAQATSDRRNLQSQGPAAQGEVARIWKVRLGEGAGTPGGTGKTGGSKGGGKRRSRRMQQTGQCDDSTLQSQTEAVNTVCSDGATAGVPTSCSPECAAVLIGEQQIRGSGVSLEPPGPLLEPPGPLLTNLRTVYMGYSECLNLRA